MIATGPDGSVPLRHVFVVALPPLPNPSPQEGRGFTAKRKPRYATPNSTLSPTSRASASSAGSGRAQR